jgi:hypothetical protein
MADVTPNELQALVTSLTAAAHSCEETAKTLWEHQKSWSALTPIGKLMFEAYWKANDAAYSAQKAGRKLNEVSQLIAEHNRRAALTPEQLVAEDDAAAAAELRRLLRKRGRNAVQGWQRTIIEGQLKMYAEHMAAQGQGE